MAIDCLIDARLRIFAIEEMSRISDVLKQCSHTGVPEYSLLLFVRLRENSAIATCTRIAYMCDCGCIAKCCEMSTHFFLFHYCGPILFSELHVERFLFFPYIFFFNSFLLCSNFEICFAEVYIVISTGPFIIGFGFMFVAVISDHQMKLQINNAPFIASDGLNTF